MAACRPRMAKSLVGGVALAFVLVSLPLVSCQERTSSRWTTAFPTTSSYPPPSVACREDMWRCRDGKECIRELYRCDGDFDCADHSDENLIMCASIVCDEDNQFECTANRFTNNTKICIPVSYLCDDDDDCGDKSDEDPANCPTTTTLLPTMTPITTSPCTVGLEFFCPASRDRGCIPITLKCDTKYDCMNGEDERGCVYNECKDDQFECNSGQCISKERVCNGRYDCRDGTDEAPDKCEAPLPECKPEEFQCKNGKCLVWYKVLCDGQNDCEDNSDEDICSTFRINECANKTLNNCSQKCEDMTFGYKCSCEPGYSLDKDMINCKNTDECTETPEVCHQICIDTPGSYTCRCADGYRDVNKDGKKCTRLDNVKPFMIFGNKYYIRRLDINGSNYASLSSEHTYTHVLDYDYRKKRIYYADAPSLKQSIKRMNFDGSGKETIEDHHVAGIEGIAVDWIADNIYWTSNKQQGMFVARTNGTSVKVLINRESKQPRAITLHPKSGYMFWTDWSLEPFIAKMGMDGSELKRIITTDLFWPNGITIDYATDQLWWIDAHLDHMETSDLNGKKRRIVVTDMPHAYAITLFEDYVYWSEWNLLRIERANRLTGGNRSVIATTLHMPYDIHVVHPLRQPMVKNPCAINNGGCSHLCLLAPGRIPGKPSRTCACPENFILNEDNKTCKINCSRGHFVCKAPDEKCLPKRFVCNGKHDCKGGEDEEGCGPHVCEETYFQCGNTTQCIPSWRLCDKVPNCRNGADEDENFCTDLECMPYEFRCKSGQCIPLAWVCDGDSDCSDASDERPINDECTKCDPEKHFQCANGKCIPRIWKCDWDDDCGDLSDEPRDKCYEWRRGTPCRTAWFACKNNYRCIPTTNLCDGNDDCRDNSDESPEMCPKCPRGDFQCVNGTPACIPARWQCDFRFDCADGSDENPATCEYRNCSENEFRCQNKKCITQDQRCDGIDNCQDGGRGSDERDCAAVSCSPYEFRCTSDQQCLSYDMVCDGIIHCDDASDETHCSTRSPDGSYCSPGQFQCANKACIPKPYVCDGEDDCKDNSDETRIACQSINCTGFNEFRCNKTLKCIPSYLKCNGIDDCGDESDEQNCKPSCYSETQFTCPNGTCISLKRVCDGVNDCGDQVGKPGLSSDEAGCVRSQFCTKTSCQQKCVNITLQNVPYHKCECFEGYVHAVYASEECEELDECSSMRYHTCQQQCTNTKGSYHCNCVSDYIDAGYFGHVCDSQYPVSMLYSIGRSLRNFAPRSGSLSNVVLQQRDIDTLAVDLRNNIVYWADISFKRIFRSLIPTKNSDIGVPQELAINNIQKVQDIAYDWMGDNIFYIDSVLNIIAVTKGNWSSIKTLQRINTRNTLKSIAVNSKLGMMFWSEFESTLTNGAIHAANMSGFGRQHKILSRGLALPSSITVDYYMNGRLFWVDRAKNTIESANYDGTDYLIIATIRHHPYSMDVFGNSIFFTTQSNRTVYEMDKFGRNADHSEFVHQAQLPISDIFIVSKNKYPMDAKDNRCLNIQCNGLCLPEPGGARCVCPDQWKQTSLETCEKPSDFTELPKPSLCQCHHGGTCFIYPEVHCTCPEGFYGRLCELAKNVTTTTSSSPRTSTQPVISSPVPACRQSQLLAAIIAPIIISVIILGLIGLVIYWLRSRYALGKLMSGHGEVRQGQPSANGQRERGTPHDHIIAEAVESERGVPIQREISFEDGAVRFSNPIYDSVSRRDKPAQGTADSQEYPPSASVQDVNTNYMYTPAAVSVPDERSEPPTVAEAVAGLAEVHLDLPKEQDS